MMILKWLHYSIALFVDGLEMMCMEKICLFTVYKLLSNSLLEFMSDLLEFVFNSLIEFILFSLIPSSSVSSGKSMGMNILLNILSCG